MRVGLRFESQTDKCCGKRAIILHVDSFSILISFAFREHWKVHEGGADVVREFCSPFFHKLKCYLMDMALATMMIMRIPYLRLMNRL